MEPRQAGLGPSFEHRPQLSQNGESYNVPTVSPETMGEHSFETPAGNEASPETHTVVPVLPTIPVPLPQANTALATDSTSDSGVPTIAADDDLIEKEWVDKAKKIIETTKDDPYRRELEIGKLQREYIRKRYGREIGEPSN